MRSHSKLALAFAAAGMIALPACSNSDVTGPEVDASEQVVIGGINVVISNILNNADIDVVVRDINVAVQICAIVEAISVDILSANLLDCDIEQRTRGGNGGPNNQVVSSGTITPNAQPVVVGGINIVITNLLNNLDIDVTVRNINVAVQVCAIVELLNAELLALDELTCEIQQR